MRKLLTLFFAVLPVFLFARPISLNEAREIATDFLNSSINRYSNGPKQNFKRAIAQAVPQEETFDSYYAFNLDNDGGFIIVSGDDRICKILGYSDKGSFNSDNVPPQLINLLDQFAKRSTALPLKSTNDYLWNKSSTSSDVTDGVLLETADWGQGYPYNELTPVVDGQQCPTGCVATAMAILMKYHKWPEEYDWDSMPNRTPDTPIESLSKLMQDAGNAVLMNYTPYESGANMNWVGHKFQQIFKYSPDCQFVSSSNFSEEHWLRMLKDNIDKGNPVIYNGVGSGGNHAFIIDGYNSYGYHINWGWDGWCNGYYALDALTPNEMQDFSTSVGMVINIEPDKTGKQYSRVFCDRGYFWATGGMAPGSHFSVDAPQQNEVFDFSCFILSYPCEDSGRLGLVLFDKEGNVKEVLNSIIYTESRDDFGMGIWGNEIRFSNNKITADVENEDYITLATQKTLSDPWVEVLGTLEAPVKKTVKEIKKDVGVIEIINNVPNSRISYLISQGEWNYLEEDIESFECVKGALVHISILDQNGSYCDNVVITVEGKQLYGDSDVYYGGSTSFPVYGDNYKVTVDQVSEGVEKEISLVEAGSLSELLKDIIPNEIGSLILSGNIDARDLWFVRDNLKNLERLDISRAKIVACESMDPVESFRSESNYHSEGVLPTFALTGLNRLKELKLPEELTSIESNSLMSLAISDIEIPSGVTSIGLNVFFDCGKLNTVVSKMVTPPYINDCVFTGTLCPQQGILFVPEGSEDAYKEMPVWQEFAQIIGSDNPIFGNQTIKYEGLIYRVHGNGLYLNGYEQSELPEDVQIPEKIEVDGHEYTVLGIDTEALVNADFESLTMSNTITSIGEWVFTNSTVKRVIMSDNISDLSSSCINGDYIEELHLPENAQWIRNSIYCPVLKKLHLPKYLKSVTGYDGSIGDNFCSLEEITVDPENQEWSVYNGILFWKGLSHLILVPNSYEGELIIPDETITVKSINNCPGINKIIFGEGVKTINHTAIYNCDNLQHIEFNNNLLFANNSILFGLPSLESFTIRDFMWSYYPCFAYLPSLTYVYLLNDNPVDFSHEFYVDVNPEHNYYTPALSPQVTIPEGCKLYVPGRATVEAVGSSETESTEMWKYDIDRSNGKLRIEPLIDGLEINRVSINDVANEGASTNIYYYDVFAGSDLDVVVDFTLHERQAMSTHYDKDFNSTIPDSEIVEQVFVETINLKPDSWTGEEGGSFTIEVEVLPENASDKSLVWSSSDESVATVDSEGNVTVLKEGNCEIIATAADGSEVSAVCRVMVFPVLVESINLTPDSWTGEEGRSFTIEAEVLPENASDKSLVWSSSDESVATVDSKGNVTVLKEGNCEIIATAVDGSDVSAVCRVTVLPVLVGTINLTPDSWTGEEGGSFTIEAEVLPKNASDKSLVWSSSDESVATVDSEGNVTVLKEGNCEIIATAADGSDVSAVCIVTGLASINEILSETEAFDIYDINGVMIKANANKESLKYLDKGIYIIRIGNSYKKILFSNHQ